jgi:hypothetical protein
MPVEGRLAVHRPDSLLRDVRLPDEHPPGRGLRRAGLVLLALVVLLGATGLLGTHTRTLHASGPGYQMSVTYALIARPGQDVPWRVRIHCDAGCTHDLTLAVSADYFRIFETQGFQPDANQTTSDGHDVYLTFNKPPQGNDFVVDYDAYIQPGSHTGSTGNVRLLVGGQQITSIRIHTWLVP